MNILKLSTWMLLAFLASALLVGQAWADDVDAAKKRGGPDGKTHENTEEVMSTDADGVDVDAAKKRGGPDGKTHENTEEVMATNKDGVNVDAPNKSAPQRLVGTEEEEFKALDINNNGIIDNEERNADAGMARQMNMIDTNNDGSIDKLEYRSYYKARYMGSRPLMHLGSNPEERAMRFKQIDKDGNGEISIDEFDAADL